MRIARVLLMLTAIGCLAADEPKKTDADSVKGSWSVVSLSVGGQATGAERVNDLKMIFEEKTYTLKEGDSNTEEGAYTLDKSKSPKTIDIDIKTGDDAGKQQVGIFKLDDKKLTLVLSFPGSKERPKSFTVETGSQQVEIVLEKVKP